MNRFFIDASNIAESHIEISGEDAGHILRVLRLTVGDAIELCDGAGTDYTAIITEVHKDRLRAELGAGHPSVGEPNVKVTLYQGMPKGSKMDLIIQKCVELGVHCIIPIDTARTITNLSQPNKSTKKIARWQKIAEEAAKQSKRGIVPKVGAPISYSELMKSAPHSMKLILWEGERTMGLKGYLDSHSDKADIGIVIGPEGGLDDDEIALAEENGWDTITLGPRILRTETAGMATLAAIMFFMEEME